MPLEVGDGPHHTLPIAQLPDLHSIDWSSHVWSGMGR